MCKNSKIVFNLIKFTSTRGQSLSGLEDRSPGDEFSSSSPEDMSTTTTPPSRGSRGPPWPGGPLGGGQATVTTPVSGSGDQQLSESQQPMTTVTTPINRAKMI